MISVELNLTEEQQRRLVERAARLGMDEISYITQLVIRDLDRMTWDEIAAPLRDAMSGSGMTEEESLAFIQGELQAARADRRAGKAPRRTGTDA
jgi:hypothetical protein